jgi:hypothetical protein
MLRESPTDSTMVSDCFLARSHPYLAGAVANIDRERRIKIAVQKTD